MEQGSIQFRFVRLWGVILLVTLGVSSYGLQLLFERSLLRRTISELSLDLGLLSEAAEMDLTGRVRLASAPRDPLYQVVYSGHYWQIMRGDEPTLRSPSLWGFKLPVPVSSATTTTPANVRLVGPDDQKLFGLIKHLDTTSAKDTRPLSILVAAGYHEIETARQRFADDLALGMLLLTALLLVAASAQVVVGLRPLHDIHTRLTKVRQGHMTRLEGSFPREIMPLVIETNALLDAQDANVARARACAADLAHGLKTPLAVMSSQSRTLRRRGDCEIANHLDTQIESMRRHVERELARARTRGGGRTHHTRVATNPAIRRLVSTIQLLPRGEQLEWHFDLPQNHFVVMDASDFDEVMGNLLDNAHKWAHSKVRVQTRTSHNEAIVCIEDDGPGLPEQDVARLLQRGERADLGMPGSGLGLAIVSDVLLAYEGRLDIGLSSLGGAAVTVTLASLLEPRS